MSTSENTATATSTSREEQALHDLIDRVAANGNTGPLVTLLHTLLDEGGNRREWKRWANAVTGKHADLDLYGAAVAYSDALDGIGGTTIPQASDALKAAARAFAEVVK